jgi:hypothetical protein
MEEETGEEGEKSAGGEGEDAQGEGGEGEEERGEIREGRPHTLSSHNNGLVNFIENSVADPHPDPYVFGPPGSVSLDPDPFIIKQK